MKHNFCIDFWMDIFALDAVSFMSFLLTLMRVSIVLFLMPFFNGDYLPVMVKASMAIVITIAIWPHLSLPSHLMPAHPLGVGLMLISEFVLGMMLGLCVFFIFAGVQTAGEIMGFQMGFTMMTLADPASGAQVSIPSNILHLVTLTVFIAMDGHLYMIRAMTASFAFIPPGGLRVGLPLAEDVIVLSAGMFSLAVKIAAPVIAALFMVELTLALMGRAAPQMNLLTLGFPAKIGVGFFFMGILFSTLSLYMEEIIMGLGPMFDKIMSAAR